MDSARATAERPSETGGEKVTALPPQNPQDAPSGSPPDNRPKDWIEIMGLLAQHYGIAHSKFAASHVSIMQEAIPPVQRIEKLARRFGLEARPVEPLVDGITARRLPLLIELSYGDIGLITELNDGEAKIIFAGDNGHWTWIPLSELDGLVTHLLMARDARTRPDERIDAYIAPDTHHWFRHLALGDLRPYAYVLLASLVANALSVAGVIFSMQVYDRVIPANSMNTLVVLFIGVGVAVIFDFMMRKVRTAIIDVIGKRADIRISDVVYGHALRVKNRQRPKATGTFISQLRDLEQVRELLTSTTVSAIADLPFFFLFLGLFAFIGGWLAVIPASALVLLIAPGVLAQRKLKRNASLAMRESSLRNAMLVESIQGIEDIKALQAEDVFQKKWNAFNAASADAQVKLRDITSTLTGWGHGVQTSTFAVIVFFGAPIVMAGDMSTGALVACSILGSRMIAPMAQLTHVLSRLQHARIGLQSLNTIMKMPVDHPPAEARLSVGSLLGEYRFRKAIFHYGEAVGRPALTLPDFKIEAGATIALLGKNGAGKSTLLQALSGQLEAHSGEALVDNLAIDHIDPSDLRREVGLLTQNSRLFHGTIRDNVLLGAQNASQNTLLEALQMTGADEFIRALPKGVDHLIDEGGRGLSGGQQQALLLSRLLIRNPSVVLLDEPTASMDEATERQFIRRFAAWSKNKTIVIATHRMRVLDLVERVVALDGGRVVLDAPKEEALRVLKGEGQKPGQDARKTLHSVRNEE
ncbi:type I secretion system permease/ATPase [Neorhizobium sp. NCHU2750]|uniref:type I secretion system permease/ATPase n=1 Tax=Neorhizobium sp. NCHU2750 TaxID=1825976 RepID=UPI000EB61114|nr:ABC transporter ATP-binding protein [Neorhizobium sp. NCHU2750]